MLDRIALDLAKPDWAWACLAAVPIVAVVGLLWLSLARSSFDRAFHVCIIGGCVGGALLVGLLVEDGLRRERVGDRWCDPLLAEIGRDPSEPAIKTLIRLRCPKTKLISWASRHPERPVYAYLLRLRLGDGGEGAALATGVALGAAGTILLRPGR